MATFSVTNTFIANTKARAAEVNQNFTDVLNILKAHHHDPNIYTNASPVTTSGIAANANIQDTQLQANITRSGLINPSALQYVTVPKGGTGLLSVAAGDMLYADSANVMKTLPIGGEGQSLIVTGGKPTWTGTGPVQFATSLTAAESITAGKPVAITLYQASPIALDNKSFGTFTTPGTTNFASVTVNAANSLLVVLISMPVNTNAFTSSCTYNGVALTWTNNDSGGGTHQGAGVGYLYNPATGTHTLAITTGNGGAGGGTGYLAYYVLTGASSSQGLTPSFAFSTTNVNYSTTTEGEVVFCIAAKFGITLTPTAGGAYNENTQTTGSVFASGESGFAIVSPIGTAVNFNYTTGGAQIPAAIISIKPAAAPVTGVQLASSAAANARSTAFIGFATTGASAGGAITVAVDGIVSSLSGLTTGAAYYLNDTNGTFGTTVGTVTRKIGIALSATQLVINNNW